MEKADSGRGPSDAGQGIMASHGIVIIKTRDFHSRLMQWIVGMPYSALGLMYDENGSSRMALYNSFDCHEPLWMKDVPKHVVNDISAMSQLPVIIETMIYTVHSEHTRHFKLKAAKMLQSGAQEENSSIKQCLLRMVGMNNTNAANGYSLINRLLLDLFPESALDANKAKNILSAHFDARTIRNDGSTFTDNDESDVLSNFAELFKTNQEFATRVCKCKHHFGSLIPICNRLRGSIESLYTLRYYDPDMLLNIYNELASVLGTTPLHCRLSGPKTLVMTPHLQHINILEPCILPVFSPAKYQLQPLNKAQLMTLLQYLEAQNDNKYDQLMSLIAGELGSR